MAKVKTVKRRCDELFSIYKRRFDAKLYHQSHPAVDPDYVACCSCGKVDRWQDMDAGHFVSREGNSTRFHVYNVHAQCRSCNRFHGGRPAGYSAFLVREYGPEILEELDELSRQLKQFKVSELLELETDIKRWIKELENE